MLTMAIPGAAL